MSTSLSRQLQKLAAPQTSILEHSNKRESILYSATDAANYSRDTYYQIGLSGFNELAVVNKRFLQFKENLFGLKTKDFQRSVETNEVNTVLDKQIEDFLLLVSPYLQKQASLKAVEWLIQRFYIHKLNVDAVMMCILPYYETVLFVRILQIIDVSKTSSPWNWVYNAQKMGRPVPKQTVYLHWSVDQWFRNFVSKYFLKMLKISHEDNHLQISSSFLFSTEIGGLLAASKITENHISSVCQTLKKAIGSSSRLVISASLVMVSHLVVSTKLTEEFLLEIVQQLVEMRNTALIEDCCMCVLNVFYHQEISTVSYTLWKALEDNPAFFQKLSHVAEKKAVACFLAPYLRASIGFILKEKTRKEKEKVELLNRLTDLLQTMPLVSGESCSIIRSFFYGLADCELEVNKLKSGLDVLEIMKKLETSHPEGFDRACASILENSIDNPESKFAKKVIEKFRKKYIISMTSFKELSGKTKEGVVLTKEEIMEVLQKSSELTPEYKKIVVDVFSHLKIKPTFWAFQSKKDVSLNMLNVIKFLNIVVRNQALDKNKSLNNLIIRKIFKEFCKNVRHQLNFLSFIWSWNSENQGCIGIQETHKIWSMKLAMSLIENQESVSGSSDTNISWVMDAKELLILSLLTPICEGGHCGSTAFEVLKTMRSIIGVSLRPNNLTCFVDEILKCKEEISADASYLPLTVAKFVSSKKGGGLKVLKELIEILENNQTPLHIKSAVLYSLSQVQHSDMFPRLLPMGNDLLDAVSKLGVGEALDGPSSSCLYYILLRFSEDPASLKVKGGWELFLRSFAISTPVIAVPGNYFSPQDLVANYKLLRAISQSEKQLEVLDAFISRITKTQNVQEASKLKKELKKITLDSRQIIALLEKYELVPKVQSVKEARARKMKQQKSGEGTTLSSEEWRKLELIMELIAVMSDIREPWLLISPICEHLQALLNADCSSADTLQQQMLSICHHLLEACSKELDDKEFVKKCQLNIALIVQIIRSSVNPDTHRRALLILSLAAKHFPNQVLHNIMAIFTFMGTSLLRRDDSYSFQVIHQTISSIVPTIIQSQDSSPKQLIQKLSQVTQVFVDALPDLAEHRRLPLFKQLAVTLGVSQYLWLVTVLIADSYVAHAIGRDGTSEKEGDSRGLPKDIKFILVLYNQFSVIDQLKATLHVIDFVSNLVEDKDDAKSTNVDNLTTCVIDMETRTPRQLRQLKFTCLGLLVHLLSSERFIAQVYTFTEECSGSEINILKEFYRNLLESGLKYLEELSHLEQANKNAPTGKFLSAMRRKLLDLVDAINALLPPALLVEIVSKLLVSDALDVQCRAMEIFASKLQPDTQYFREEDLENVCMFIEPLCDVGKNVKLPEHNRQTAFFTLQLLVRRLTVEENLNQLLRASEEATKLIKNGDPSSKVLTQAILVVAESVNVLKVNAVVHLGNLVPALLKIIQRTLKEDEVSHQDHLVIASVTAVHKVVEHLPRLLPESDLDQLLNLCCRIISKQESGESKDSRLTIRLTGILEHLIRNVELRILIPCLIKTYQSLSAECVSSMCSLMKVIESVIKSVRSSNLSMFKQKFIDFFTTALDVRTTLVHEDYSLVYKVESSIISALTKFHLKMDEDDNITILVSLQNWAEEVPSRLTTFFRFSSELCGCLKVLFIKAKLAEKVFDIALQHLVRNNSVVSQDTTFGAGDEAETKASELLQFVIETLSRIFLYDTVNFTSAERFSVILEPLVNQIENTLGTDKDYERRISDYLKPCLIRLMKALTDDSLWKEANRRVLQQISTNNEPKIVLAALEIFEGLMDSLGEEFLQPVLADTIPCIIEVLESMDCNIQNRTKEIYLKMESIVGDSLKSYLVS